MLSKLNRMRVSREQGFTLIELLVVILIIGILAAIAIPMFLNQRKAAVDSSVQSDVTNAAKQVETWITTQGATRTNIPGSGSSYTVGANGATVLPTGVAGETGLEDIKLSDGTTLTIEGDSFGYTIRGENPGGNAAATTDGIEYDSEAGGLQ